MTTTIDVNQVQPQLAELLKLAQSGGEVIIADGSTPVARLIAVTPTTQNNTRIAGLHQGAIEMSDDFDQPLPDEFWLGAQ